MEIKIYTKQKDNLPRYIADVYAPDDEIFESIDITDKIEDILSDLHKAHVAQMHELRKSFEDKISRYEQIQEICNEYQS